jgi:hypothetical protein
MKGKKIKIKWNSEIPYPSLKVHKFTIGPTVAPSFSQEPTCSSSSPSLSIHSFNTTQHNTDLILSSFTHYSLTHFTNPHFTRKRIHVFPFLLNPNFISQKRVTTFSITTSSPNNGGNLNIRSLPIPKTRL